MAAKETDEQDKQASTRVVALDSARSRLRPGRDRRRRVDPAPSTAAQTPAAQVDLPSLGSPRAYSSDRPAAPGRGDRPLRAVSPGALRDRRRHLRRRRRWNWVRLAWQAGAIAALGGGLVWLATSPMWLIRGPEQVAVVGNRLLSAEAVRKLAGLSYPQPVWKWQPEAIAAELKSRGPLAEVRVRRELLPPRLEIWVRELYPVAVLHATGHHPTPPAAEQVGLLDDRGNWIDLQRFRSQGAAASLPPLEVSGNYEQIRVVWPAVYRQLRESPVAIDRVDWRDPGALRLETAIGVVDLGRYDPAIFSEQIRALGKLRDLGRQVDARRVGAIDLTNPQLPLLRSPLPTPTASAKPSPSPSPGNLKPRVLGDRAD